MRGDPRGGTIVLNLISNAFKFTLEGAIAVTVAEDGPGQIEVAVTDTGTGIAEDDLQRLFERFYRAEKTRGRTAEGTGIGLALVRNLVELHGGAIRVESRLGAGTRMAIRLPAAAIPAVRAEPVVPAVAREGAENPYVAEALQWLGDGELEPTHEVPERPLILVADDNADMRLHLQRILRSCWNTVTVKDGAAALEFTRAHRPDLLVTDVMMPTLDGFGLVAAIRADDELASLPVIILSARAAAGSAGEGLAAGADDYLVKPFRSRDLLDRVSARLAVASRDRRTSERHERSARRSAALAELSGALGAATTVSRALSALLAEPIASLGATVGAIAMLEPSGNLIRISFLGEDLPGEFADRYHVVSFDAPIQIADVIRENQPRFVPDTALVDPRYQAVAADAASAVRASLLQPLRGSDGRVIGGLSLSWPVPRTFDAEEQEFSAQVAHVIAQALERIEISEREHRIATALQERLLDLELRSTNAVVSATYQPASELMRVGGDWYTATTLEQGCVGVSVGDVVGHGLEGATAMSQLRSALGVAALTSTEPTGAIDLLDAYANRIRGAACGTVAYAVIDAAKGSVRYTCAGHPYPLLVTAEGEVSYLTGGRRPPLASPSSHRASTASTTPSTSGLAPLPPGSLLVLYTDGLIERRGESLDAGFDRLRVAATGCVHLPVGEVCARLVQLLDNGSGYSDDVALVAVRPVGSTSQSFVLALAAERAQVTPTRHLLRNWLRACAFPPDDSLEYDVLVGVGEALINAIEHGSRLDANRIVWLEVFAHDDRILASVSDSGRWVRDSAASRRDSSRGRGLTLIHGLSTDVRTVRTILGTRVLMTFGHPRVRRAYA